IDGNAGCETEATRRRKMSEDRPKKTSRAIVIAASAPILLGAGPLAFYKLPPFHNPLSGPAGGTPAGRTTQPGKSPMAMDRVPVYEDEAIGMVAMNPTQRLMANVATEKVSRREFVLDTFAVGKISWDERKVAKVSARIAGRVERLFVDFTGTRVVRGQPMLEIYSPDLVASQREYLLALAMHDRMKENPYPEERDMAERLVQASRTRLKLWGVTDAQIEELEKTKEPKTVFMVYAPGTGVGTVRLGAEGA